MRRTRVTAVFAVILSAILGACAPMQVGSHVDRQVDFTRYRTFDWGPSDPLPAGDPRFEDSAFFQDHMQGAIERQMVARGYERSAPGAEPDVRVHFHAVVERRLNVSTIDAQRGYCTGVDCSNGVVEFEQGSLIVDVVDTRTGRLVWRGWAQSGVDDLFENQDRLAARIEKAVAGALQRLPPSR